MLAIANAVTNPW